MEWGIQTWDANGVPNNYGIKPISVVGIIDLLVDQKTGSYSFNLEPGLKVGFTVGTEEAESLIAYTNKRNILASGNTITIQPSTGDGVNDYPANQVQLIVFAEKV